MNTESTPKEKPTVLYVDDEQQNLVSFRAGFRKVYNVLTANSGHEALEILTDNHQKVSVIISDQRMPKMTGVELFEQVRELYPDIMRIVLTGYSDVQDIINAISKGEVYRYITKPWDRDELKVTLDNAIEAFELKKENKKLFTNLKAAYSQLEEDAKMLEIKVAERTKELQAQKEQLLQQKEELENSRKSLKRKQIVLQKQNEELMELDSEKNHLIGIVAHDLKSPLNQIEGLVELIKMDDENLNDEQREYIEHITSSIKRQQNMIMQILDLNAIEAKKSNMVLSHMNLGELLTDVADRFALSAEKKQIKITTDIDKDDSFAMVDENYFTQIFQNLISNAIKFSPEGKGVHLTLKEEKGSLQATVKDEGPGLSEEDKSKLFGKFQKLSARPTAGEHSTGLGLSIVKKLAEELGAKVWCESTHGEGASFIVEFKKSPIAEAKDHSASSV
ncbi:hybrid sensor histidine kinase/response regulator [Limibacter armeniacum]|uniref:hybrid sensor histidine kinase/response regulator n=1 Tax=Limibacter armeniacum TaxID=466084 RepID=UPI002FE63A48